MMKKSSLRRGIGIAFIFLLGIVFAFPFFWMFVTAVKPVEEVFAYPPLLWPSELRLENFAESMRSNNFGVFFKNSSIVTVIATIITVFILRDMSER